MSHIEPSTAHGRAIANGHDKTAMPTIPRPTVRTAGPLDEREVCRLLLIANAENAIFPADNQRVLFIVKRFLYGAHIPPNDLGPRGIIGVIGPKGGILEGLCVLGIGQMWYSSERHLEEFIVYVDPLFRNVPGRGGHGTTLLNWIKTQCEMTGLKLMTGILTNHRTEAKCRLYRRHFQKLGEFFGHAPNGKPIFHSDSNTESVSTPGR
jgi:hypothetical protein